MLDEPTGVSGFACEAAQVILEGCKRADPVRESDPSSPDGGRDVQISHFRPPQSEQATGHDEDDEREVDENDQVGGDAEKHGDNGRG